VIFIPKDINRDDVYPRGYWRNIHPKDSIRHDTDDVYPRVTSVIFTQGVSSDTIPMMLNQRVSLDTIAMMFVGRVTSVMLCLKNSIGNSLLKSIYC